MNHVFRSLPTARLGATALVMLSVAAPAAASTATLVSEPGHPLGQGETRTFTELYPLHVEPVDDGITVEGRDHRITVSMSDGEAGYSVTFMAPGGVPLTPGVYEDAYGGFESHPDNPLIQVARNAESCFQDARGRFVIHEVKVGRFGYVERLRASFEHTCGPDTEPALFGEIDVANPPPPPPMQVRLTFLDQGTVSRTGDVRFDGVVYCERPSAAEISSVITQGSPRTGLPRGERLYLYVDDCSPTGTRFTVDVPIIQGRFRPGPAMIRAKAAAIDFNYPLMVVERVDEPIRLMPQARGR